jgi:two-component system response regulator HydG
MSRFKKRILVVDDEAGIRTSLARILRASGYDVRVAKDGFEAIEVSAGFVPGLLLVDLRMPGIDGVDTFRRMRQQIPSLVAILMTAYAGSVKADEQSEHGNKQSEHGAMLVQSKPLDIDALLSAIDTTSAATPLLENQ